MSVDTEKIKRIIAKQLNINYNDIYESASFVEDLGADSIDTVELIMAFELEFGIDIPEEEAYEINSVNAAVNYIESKLREN